MNEPSPITCPCSAILRLACLGLLSAFATGKWSILNRTLEMSVKGLLSSNYLKRVPESVVAAAGQTAWRSDMAPAKQSVTEMQQQWNEFIGAVADDLETYIRLTDSEMRNAEVV